MKIKAHRNRRIMYRKGIVCGIISIALFFAMTPPLTVSATEWTGSKSVHIADQLTKEVFYTEKNDVELPAIPLPGQQKKLQGDTDGNGEVNYMDALLVLRHSIGLEHLSDAAVTRCDVDSSGELTYMDALLILRYSIGLIAKF